MKPIYWEQTEKLSEEKANYYRTWIDWFLGWSFVFISPTIHLLSAPLQIIIIIIIIIIINVRVIKRINSRHGVNSILSIPIPHQIYQFQFNSNFKLINSNYWLFLPTAFYHEYVLQIPTLSTYLEYLLRVPTWNT